MYELGGSRCMGKAATKVYKLAEVERSRAGLSEIICMTFWHLKGGYI